MIARRLAVVAVLGGCLLAVTACSGNGKYSAHDHGKVVAHLPIPYTSRLASGKTEVIRLAVAVGERFSVKVDTSDGPLYWRQVGTAPDPLLVKVVGDFNDGHCAADLVGCRVPFFHVLAARARGTTTMSWRYHNLSCAASGKAPGHAGHPCVKTATVTFRIQVR